MSHSELIKASAVRVLFCEEGEFTVAYLAKLDTREGMMEVGRMRTATLREDKLGTHKVLYEMWATVLADWLAREIVRHQIPCLVKIDREDEKDSRIIH